MRPALLAGGVALLMLFAADAAYVLAFGTTRVDLAIVLAVQHTSWGSLAALFGLVDWLEGVRQALLAIATVAVVALLNRRARWFAFLCFLSGGGYWLTQEVIRRPRPSAALVHVVRHTSDYSFPSGHEVFFTWWVAVLTLALVAPFAPRLLVPAWLLAAVVVVFVAISRLWEGEHWATDVLGGVLLGGGWTLIAFAAAPPSGARHLPKHGSAP